MSIWRVTFCDEPYETEEFPTRAEAEQCAVHRAENAERESDIEEVATRLRVRIKRTPTVEVVETKCR